MTCLYYFVLFLALGLRTRMSITVLGPFALDSRTLKSRIAIPGPTRLLPPGPKVQGLGLLEGFACIVLIALRVYIGLGI